MKTQQMSKDEFAKFIAGAIFEMKHYNFDMFYDIRKIMEELKENRGNTEEPILSTFHLMLRNTGCDMVRPEDENYKLYTNRSDTVYSLIFCYNHEYLHNRPFVSVTKIQ